MIDQLVHNAKVASLKGGSCRLQDHDLERVPTDKPE